METGIRAMYFSSNDSLEPRDLSLLRRVLEEVCNAENISIKHPDAEQIAADLVNWYLFGIKDPDQLKAMLNPMELCERVE
ncbi:hypothetical protein J2X76_006016 [Neorhizobium sp. 2083]|uniref:hypothetical protein n=1 Tax=Neorhizobium sp. 2083 TaxID=2817762 RepID=UPI0028599DAE|nr:hypothetical protein [Neorhizobium sp. 2083]MDR6820816.1 hypothetical protein [Neorhizobium sp. 2083]